MASPPTHTHVGSFPLPPSLSSLFSLLFCFYSFSHPTFDLSPTKPKKTMDHDREVFCQYFLQLQVEVTLFIIYTHVVHCVHFKIWCVLESSVVLMPCCNLVQLDWMFIMSLFGPNERNKEDKEFILTACRPSTID